MALINRCCLSHQILKDGKLWRALNPGEAQQLHKGQAVELTPTKTGKGKDGWNIRPLAEPTQSQRAGKFTAKEPGASA